MQERPKAYEAVLQLGIATDTEDMTGTVIESQAKVKVTEAEVHEVLKRFIGQIDQVPPMYSAIKIDGKRLYDLAREGITVERKSRTVTIYELNVIETQLDLLISLDIVFCRMLERYYIRTLCVDIGKALGVPATMATLTRTMSAGITKESCLTLEQIEQLQLSGQLSEHLIATDDAIDYFDKAVVPASIGKLALQGQRVSLSHAEQSFPKSTDGQLVRFYNDENIFLGIYQIDMRLSVFKPVKVFTD